MKRGGWQLRWNSLAAKPPRKTRVLGIAKTKPMALSSASTRQFGACTSETLRSWGHMHRGSYVVQPRDGIVRVRSRLPLGPRNQGGFACAIGFVRRRRGCPVDPRIIRRIARATNFPAEARPLILPVVDCAGCPEGPDRCPREERSPVPFRGAYRALPLRARSPKSKMLLAENESASRKEQATE